MELTITKDTAELERLESEMRQDQVAFYRFGSNLIRIRDRELYLLKNGGAYQTFEAYCKGEWDFNSRRARQIMAATETIDNIKSGTTGTAPTNERQARPLTSLPAEQQAPAWQRAVATAPDGKVTAAHISKIVKGMTNQEPEPQNAEPEKPRELVEDSAKLANLKTMWNACGNQDKARFMKWIREYFSKYNK